jgi:hypothetical protein
MLIIQFFLYNNYNNYIINNKSDKNKILNLQMAVTRSKRVQWCLCIKQCKRATNSGAFALARPDHDSLPLDQHYYC